MKEDEIEKKKISKRRRIGPLLILMRKRTFSIGTLQIFETIVGSAPAVTELELHCSNFSSA